MQKHVPETKIIGSHDSHDAIMEALNSVKPRKILDVPVGEGPLSQWLSEKGWDVHCADIDKFHFKLNLPFTEVNLNRPLPFKDSEFEAIAMR